MCGEAIMAGALKCRFCGEVLDPRAYHFVAATPDASPRNSEDLRRIAKRQTALLFAVLLNLISYFLLALPYHIGLYINVAIYIFQVICIFRLATALGSRVAWLWALGALIPCVSFILLYAVNGLATNALQSCGVRVGLFGARLADIESAG